MSLFKSNKAIIAAFTMSLMISATDTQAQTSTDNYTENNVTISVDMKEAMELAETLYPGLFKTPSILRKYSGPEGVFSYRFYRTTQTYIGFQDGKIYLMGGAFGNAPTEYGEVNSVLGQLREVYTARFGEAPGTDEPVVEIPDVDIPEGDFDLDISGTVTTSGIVAISVPFGGLTIEDIPAPGPDDIDEMTRLLEEEAQLQNLRDVSVVQRENSANRVVFELELTADTVAAGITSTATYKLLYTYTR